MSNDILHLIHLTKSSHIVLFDDGHIKDVINYYRKIHKYEAESDYSTMATEYKTYGDKALAEVFNYMKATRKDTK